MGLIFEAGNHGREDIPKRLVPLIVFSTWLSHLFGASVGREGVAVQIGGVIGHAIGKNSQQKKLKNTFDYWYGCWFCRALSNANRGNFLCY